MFLTCHEKIGRVGLVGRGCYEDTIATYLQQVVRISLVEFGERHDTRTNGQHYTVQQTTGRPTNQVRTWPAEREVARHARATSS